MLDRCEIEAAGTPQIVRIGEAHAVRQQIAHRDFARDVRIGELHVRLVFLDRIVERQARGVGEHGHEHGGERLGGGHVAEARVHRHGIGLAELAHAVALDEGDGVVLDHDDGEAGNAPVLHCLRDVGIEAVQRRLLLRQHQQEREDIHGDQSCHVKKRCATVPRRASSRVQGRLVRRILPGV